MLPLSMSELAAGCQSLFQTIDGGQWAGSLFPQTFSISYNCTTFTFTCQWAGSIYPQLSIYPKNFRYSLPSQFILQLSLLHVSEQVFFTLTLSIHLTTCTFTCQWAGSLSPQTFNTPSHFQCSAVQFLFTLRLKVSTRGVNSSPFFNTSSHFHFSLPLSISPTLRFIRVETQTVAGQTELLNKLLVQKRVNELLTN